MRTASFALLAGLLSTLASAAPADAGTVLKVGDQPEKEFFAKRDLVERATTSTYNNRATYKPMGITRTVVYANATSTAAAVSSSKPATSSTVSKASTTTALAAAAPSSTLGSDIRSAVLNEHNTFRALHSAPALVWNQTLADKAASWANKCVFQHSQGALGRYGENLAASAGSGVTVQTALSGIKAWEAEAPDYTPATPNYSHFTQMVWKASKQLGCYQASCPAGSIFDARYGVNSFLVCEYDPPGNVYPASNFAINVTP
ncbi:hypothetical protein JCM8208_005807 [Rhodotorula glutinis]